MIDFELKNVDPDDLGDLLIKIEKSFSIHLDEQEFFKIKTFVELCDLITNQIQLEHTDDCTSQQAFYKVRSAFSTALQIDRVAITPNTILKNLFQKENRRYSAKEIEKKAGLEFSLLKPPT